MTAVAERFDMTSVLDLASFGATRTEHPVVPSDASGLVNVPGLGAAPSFADLEEIDRYEHEVAAYLAGDLDPEAFRRVRLWHGVYGQRQVTDIHMIRLKVPGGALTADALDACAEVAQTWSRGWGHLTTRQNVQFHFVDVRDTPAVLRRMATAGVTTREACGDTVRNVTACHLAGVCPLEILDVNAAAEAVARHFLRNPIAQNLPRKFKVAASGCAVDCALTGIHDLGILAAEVDGVKGFKLMCGGGLGSAPHEAVLLEPLTDPADLIVTAEAILRVWDREMPRGKRAHARMKFLVAKIGAEAFREKVLTEREQLRCSADFRDQYPEAFLPPRTGGTLATPTRPEAVAYESVNPEAFAAWKATNVIEQRQVGRFAAYVTVPMGDVTTAQFRTLATTAREHGLDWRVTVRQNLVARGLRAGDLPRLFDTLATAELGASGAERARNVVSCPGAETCNLALTSSRGVARATTDALIAAGLGDVPLSINVSGCPNSCGQQQMADIGLSGQVRRVGTDEAPGYRILLGGRVTGGGARFGKYVAKAPAKRTPEAIVSVVRQFVAQQQGSETFGQWVDRVGPKEIGATLAEFDAKRSREEAPEDFTDWGASEAFEVILGRGECA
jgi:sulfite reductase (ferredoxin)